MVHTRLASIRKKKYILPTNKSKSDTINTTDDSDETPFKITLKVKDDSAVPDNQTQAAASTQDEVSSSGGTKEATTEFGVPQTQAQVFVASLGGKKATELEKTPVEEPITGEKSSNGVSRGVVVGTTAPPVGTSEERATEDSANVETSPTLSKLTPEDDVFSDLNCEITKLLPSPERKSIVKSLKRVSSSLITCQRLYSKHVERYQKQEIQMLDQVMQSKLVERKTSEKIVTLEQQVAKLEATTDKLRFQLRQRNMHEGDLRKTYLAQKREQKALDEAKILKLEKELQKMKNAPAGGGKNTMTMKLENEKLKESLRSTKVLHKDQLRIKEGLITDQNSTIKSLKSKVKTLENSLEKLNSKFSDFQRQSVSNIAKLEHKKELIEIKEKQKKSTESKKRKEMAREKEFQKRKLQDAINLHSDLSLHMPDENKYVQRKIINNFRHKQQSNSVSAPYLVSPPQFMSASVSTPTTPYSSYAATKQVAPASFYSPEVNGNNTIDLTDCPPSQHSMGMVPTFISLLNSLDDDNEKREKKKRKLMKVCVDSARSALKKKRSVEDSGNVKLTTDASTSTGFSNGDDSDSNENWEKLSSDDRKLPANKNLPPTRKSVAKHDSDTTCDFDESQSLL